MTSKVLVSLRVAASAEQAFAVFTREIGQWWQPNDLFQFTPRSPGVVALEPRLGGAFTEIHQEIADLLHSPRPVRVGSHAEDAGVTGAGLHHEEAVQALEGHRAVHMEEAGGEHRRGLRLQELPPRRIGAAQRRRRDLQRFADSANCRCADPVTEPEQLTVDPLVPPAVVPGGEAPGQRGNLPADLRPA